MEELEKKLTNLAEALNKTTDTYTKELGQQSLEYMTKQYSLNNMSGHIGNINLKAYKKRYSNGFVISSGNDEVAIYNEFGTGIVGIGTNPLAGKAGYQYNIGITRGTIPEGAIKEYGKEFCESVTTPDTWWYHKNNKWWYTKGMEGKNMYSSLADKLRESAGKKFRVAISETISNYGGR